MAVTIKATNCKECGTLFLDTGRGLCRNCILKREEQMDEIASFVRDNPRSSVGEICEALDVKQSLVLEMLRSGRLEETNIQVRYPCASCGKMIR
ncbi:MAG: flagellar protein, partial [Schwartzia sp.]|nr:flagellar protein [Schwartzia sp. (in: firmicutes)]